MSGHACTENQRVGQPATGLFAGLGWQTVVTMEDWPQIKLGDISQICSGFAFRVVAGWLEHSQTQILAQFGMFYIKTMLV